MLNENQERELCYVVNIDGIEPIVGSDNCEAAIVGGWKVMVRKNTFAVGDKAVYFEIDSKVPETETFAFLAQKHYKVKTQKYTFGGKNPGFYSQGLLMSFSDFGWDDSTHEVGDFLTKELGVVYYEAEDNKRKANSSDKYKKMAQRNGKLFKHWPFRQLMRYKFGRKFLFVFFGRKRDKKSGWPEWVKKTDEERVQNMPWVLTNKDPFIVTEKIDGTSTTFTMKRGKFGKNEFYVCSRNVVFDKPDKQCFYDTNVYTEMAVRYDIENVLSDMLKEHKDWNWVTIQGETYGAGVQKRNYSLTNHDFAAFNFITSADGRWNSYKAKEFLNSYGVPFVPIISTDYVLPDTVDELINFAIGNSVIDGLPREGYVFRSQDGSVSFKAVSPEFLMKYHG